MEGKRESFFKRYQFLAFVLLAGVLFLTGINRWDLYETQVLKLGKDLQDFLGLEIHAGRDAQHAEDGGDAAGGEENEEYAALNEGEEDGGEGQGALDDAGEAEGTGKTETRILTWQTVDESYFDDALFIGDSRVVGLRDYGKLQGHATFYAYEGLNIFRLLTAKIVEVPDEHKKISVEEALGERQFAKIYLMTGINELDIGTVERFGNTYQEIIDRIRELQPEAEIYIQSIMLVTQKRAAKGDFVKNTDIMERNEALKNLADGEHVFYLDVNEAIVDESGGMNPTYTSDGVHLKAKYVPLWTEYLKTHVISVQIVEST